MYLQINAERKIYMETIKLGEICKVISRGYNYARNEVCKEKFDYYSAPQISYSNVDEDGRFAESEEIVLIRKETADKYWVKKNDIILPPTTKNFPRAKGIANYLPENEDLKQQLIYSQSVVFLRVEPNAPITNIKLMNILNTKDIQESLLKEVYSKGEVKSISLEKLRKFEIPLTLTDRQKATLSKYIEVSEKFYQAKRRFEEEFWNEDF